ncbi:MAG: preprotein translocase subunit SecY [Erysipelotrichaceae bacterium]|nr:preprotein translocase subunit SecY [Erysipelotrichaceae bacterium]
MFLKNRKIRNKLLVTTGVMLLYIIGKNIRAPGFNGDVIDILGSSFLSMLNLIGGGAIEQMSLFSLGIGPYLSASIVISLLSSADVIPFLVQLREDGRKGQKKIEYITFCFGSVLSVFQGYFLARSLSDYVTNPGTRSYLFIAAILTIGAMITYGLGMIIDKWGIGSGMSMIIFAGIVSGIPYSFYSAYNALDIKMFIAFTAAYLFVIIAVIIVQEAERRIPIQYSRAMNTTKGNFTHLPLKINSASVMPVIFASALIQAPQIIMSWINYDIYRKMNKALSMNAWYMLLIYALLIIAFAFFYANVQIDPKKVARNLAKEKAYVPGIRPGKETERYISRILNSITCLGSVLLALIALLPYLVSRITGYNLSLGGTGIIIAVGVALEFYNAIRTEMTEKKYKSFVGK